MPSNPKGKITQAFIMAAGLGTRLASLTDMMPKVMVPIADGKPLLEHTIELLRAKGITDILINVSHHADAIISYFGDGSAHGVRIRYSDERDGLLETGGALKKAEAMLNQQFLVLYGDLLHFFDIHRIIDLYEKKDGIGAIVLKESQYPKDGDVADFDTATGRILSWYPRPHDITELGPGRLLNVGIYAFSKNILRYIPAGLPVKLDGEVIPNAIAAGEILYALPAGEPILDIGKPEKYEQAKAYYRERR